MTRALSAQQFSILAAGGLGQASAAVHAMARFRGAIYVATAVCDATGPREVPRILRYAGDPGAWAAAYASPLVAPTARSQLPDRQLPDVNAPDGKAPAERPVPRDSGYRSMCVFRGRSDEAPALYVSTMSRSGGTILRSLDGEKFEVVGEPGLGEPDVYSFRCLVEHEGRMFAVPAGQMTDAYLDAEVPPRAAVLVSEDPARGIWADAAEAGFGDPGNVAVSSLCSAFGRLYAGTANPDFGFQIWHCEPRGAPPFEWTPAIIDGGAAFNRNLTVAAMTEFRGALYVGSGVTGLGRNSVYDIGPASGELLRLRPDGSWDLIAGQMRFTPDGLKAPLSQRGPGLGDFYNSLVCSLAVHDDVLYVGTYQWEAARCLEIGAADLVGGYQLWASADGAHLTEVIDDGHGNPADFAVRAMLSTPAGLLLGTDNQAPLLALLAGGRALPADLKSGFAVLLGR
jgi:hypothetical protein